MVCQNSVRVGILQALEAQAAPTLVITGPNFYVCVCVCVRLTIGYTNVYQPNWIVIFTGKMIKIH